MSKAYTFRLDPDLIAEVDRVRGDVNRTRFVQRALESALDGSSAGSSAATTTRQGRPLPSASTRAPVEKDPLFSALGADTFSCPVNGCDFTAKSPKAVCQKHGRTVR